MIESAAPTDLVLALVRVISGDTPGHAAREILDPMVQMHMDSSEYCGIDIWYRWIHLIRNCGRIDGLRLTHCQVQCDVRQPGLVHLSARWRGTIRSRGSHAESPLVAASYLVYDGRIKELWSTKSNYEFIFGRWISYHLCFNAFLLWSVLYSSFRSRCKRDVLGLKILRGLTRKRDLGQPAVTCSWLPARGNDIQATLL